MDKIHSLKENNSVFYIEEQKNKWEGRSVIFIIGATAVNSTVVFVWKLAISISEFLKSSFFSTETLSLSEAERHIEEKKLGLFGTKIKEIKAFDSSYMRTKIGRCQKHEEELLKFLEENFFLTKDHLEELLKGAYVLLEDEGETYQVWKNLIDETGHKAAKRSTSSHPSKDRQFRLRGVIISELLFSTIEQEGKLFTWFQLERNPLKFGHLVGHMVDYAKYKVSGANQGPFGQSPFTHRKPLRLQKNCNGECIQGKD